MVPIEIIEEILANYTNEYVTLRLMCKAIVRPYKLHLIRRKFENSLFKIPIGTGKCMNTNCQNIRLTILNMFFRGFEREYRQLYCRHCIGSNNYNKIICFQRNYDPY